jgi:hypothetical protein
MCHTALQMCKDVTGLSTAQGKNQEPKVSAAYDPCIINTKICLYQRLLKRMRSPNGDSSTVYVGGGAWLGHAAFVRTFTAKWQRVCRLGSEHTAAHTPFLSMLRTVL